MTSRICHHASGIIADETEQGVPSLLDSYWATHPAEFFAVVTECVFESPGALRATHPRLYEALRLYYRQDRTAADFSGI